jgi:hypothetical protein
VACYDGHTVVRIACGGFILKQQRRKLVRPKMHVYWVKDVYW